MAEPKADKPRCDVPGCGMFAESCTDGSEVDVQGLGRKPLVGVNVCARHHNWPFSTDAQEFALKSDGFKSRAKV